MSEQVKSALIIGAAIVGAVIGAVSLWIYFSPYQSCLRVLRSQNTENAELRCAVYTSGNRGT
jgi:hypothetical protein